MFVGDDVYVVKGLGLLWNTNKLQLWRNFSASILPGVVEHSTNRRTRIEALLARGSSHQSLLQPSGCIWKPGFIRNTMKARASSNWKSS